MVGTSGPDRLEVECLGAGWKEDGEGSSRDRLVESLKRRAPSPGGLGVGRTSTPYETLPPLAFKGKDGGAGTSGTSGSRWGPRMALPARPPRPDGTEGVLVSPQTTPDTSRVRSGSRLVSRSVTKEGSAPGSQGLTVVPVSCPLPEPFRRLLMFYWDLRRVHVSGRPRF